MRALEAYVSLVSWYFLLCQSLCPQLHPSAQSSIITWFFWALNLSWILWGWLVPGTCILLLLLRLLLPLPFFQIKKKNPLLFLLLFFFCLFGFIHFSFLNGVWGGRRTYMFSMVCFRKEDGSTLAVPWLGVASNWSHSRLWLLHQPLGLREHLKYLNRRQNRAFQMSSESSNVAQNCLYLACLCFCCPCRTEEGDPAWFLHAEFYSRGHELSLVLIFQGSTFSACSVKYLFPRAWWWNV